MVIIAGLGNHKLPKRLTYLYISPYRFGPGMVIYWFGYVKEIDVHAEDGIIVHSTFAA